MEDEGEKEDHEHEEEDKEDEQEEPGEEDDNGIEDSEQFGLEDNVVESPLPKVNWPRKNTKVVKKKGKTMEKMKPTHLKTSTCSGGATFLPSNTHGKSRSSKNIDQVMK